MHRSLVTIDVGAIRDNARTLAGVLGRSELWAVVKADGYGHGALAAGRAALEGGATTLCVATVGEALVLRAALPDARLVVLGPTTPDDVAHARDAQLELAVPDERLPEGVPLHLKLDTGMGRWGLAELTEPSSSVVGLMTHFATADTDPGFARDQLARFLEATKPYAADLTRHAANSAAALTFPESRLDAARCGIALYGIDPLGSDPARVGLRPALRFRPAPGTGCCGSCKDEQPERSWWPPARFHRGLEPATADQRCWRRSPRCSRSIATTCP